MTHQRQCRGGQAVGLRSGGKCWWVVVYKRRHFSTTVVSGVDIAGATFCLGDWKVVRM